MTEVYIIHKYSNGHLSHFPGFICGL